MRLFDTTRQISDTTDAPRSADDPSGPEGRRHARYHRLIVHVGCCFAVLGAVIGLIAYAAVAGNARSPQELKFALLWAPAVYGVAGFVFGTALTCLLAPRAFLTGPAGGPWMRLIGTRSVVVARLACLAVVVILTAPLVGVGLLIALGE